MSYFGLDADVCALRSVNDERRALLLHDGDEQFRCFISTCWRLYLLLLGPGYLRRIFK